MNWLIPVYAALAAGAGACIALQATANTKFRANLHNPGYAAFFSICGTFLTACTLLLAFTVLARPPAPTASGLRETQWWNWIGGPLGALIVLAGATLTRELGAAAFIAFVVAGQLTCSLLLDHFAMMGLPESPITWQRLLGATLVVLGVVCIKFL
ncbi:MAG: DMT family transporter [Fimbriiglobus sp.]